MDSGEIRNLSSLVRNRLGPVLLLEPVKESLVSSLRERLERRVIVSSESIASEEDVGAAIELLIEEDESGEPHISGSHATGLAVLAKLWKGKVWGGGSANKNYIYAADLPKGRGMPIELSPNASSSANFLKLKGLLVTKPSNGKTKYALNGNRQSEIAEILQTRLFPPDIQRVLDKDSTTVSIRLLDSLFDLIDDV